MTQSVVKMFGSDHYESLPSGYPYKWSPAHKGDHPHDNRDYHIDIGGGRLPKARFNIDHKSGVGVDLAINLDDKELVLPFEDNVVKSTSFPSLISILNLALGNLPPPRSIW